MQAEKMLVYDEKLHIEACYFIGKVSPFPNHFHEHYVIGLIECGNRCLSCKNKEYALTAGSVVIFNPADNHACAQADDTEFSYRGINISPRVMLDLAKAATGRRELPAFSVNVIHDAEIAGCLREIHKMVMDRAAYSMNFAKEERLLFLIAELVENYGQRHESVTAKGRQEIAKACEFIEQSYASSVSLEQICRHAGLSKSTLLRAFTRIKGITPYRYLETVRINAASELLKNGMRPLDAAMQTGFSDQSHFTNYFTSFIGLAPSAYCKIFSETKAMRGAL
jgi:AraC-like DNA-binding protein